MILSMLIMGGLLYLSDAQVLALIIAAQVEEVALVACPDDVAASVCGCQTGRCRDQDPLWSPGPPKEPASAPTVSLKRHGSLPH